jgi:hypothetical protein
MIKKMLLMLSIIFPLTNCTKKKTVTKEVNIHAHVQPTKTTLAVSKPHITVWVHGTKSLGGISDHLHAIHRQGLTHHTTIPNSYRIGSVIKSLIASDPAHFPAEHFYAFGWSGKLSFDERIAESKKLYAALQVLVTDYHTKYGEHPHLTLITHSHGGNVALNLSHWHDKENPLVISELIVLACPVQHETAHLIAHDMFEKVYCLYSTTDMIQVLDPQGLYLTEHNSKRHWEFSARKFPLYPNVRQAKLKINKHGIMHVGFVTKTFIKMLPFIIDQVEQWHAQDPQCVLERELRVHT